MITIHWILLVPPGWTREAYDAWYLEQHTRYGKNSPNIVRYCVNRALADQPAGARGEAFRVAEECWDDFGAAEASWNAPLGHAVLGDAVANLGLLDARSLPGIAVTEDTSLPVARPAVFDTLKRGFAGSRDGTIVKFLAFGMARRGAQFSDWYEQSFASLGADRRLRQHIVGRSIGRQLQVGRLITIPGEQGQLLYDWALELWFDDGKDARAFLADEAFAAMWKALQAECTDMSAALYRGQEMMLVADPVPHRDGDI